jgi:hypothetical protein
MSESRGGIIVEPGGSAGALVSIPGQLQYGDMLMGGGTSAGWRELVGWRDLPAGEVSDYPRPQGHGAYPGDVWGGPVTVTFTFLLRSATLADRAEAIAALEQFAPMDGVDRMLAVNDTGDGTWFRMARVTGRSIPQDHHFGHAPLVCSIQFLCADPRRYSLTEYTRTVTQPSGSGGLIYPLAYPLDYGTWTGGGASGSSLGAVDTPLVATFIGPMASPVLHGPDWTLAFDINLAAGESLVVDTLEGTALLNGTTDRAYTISTSSDPIERCLIHPGENALSLSVSGSSGTGTVLVTYRDARM